MVTEPALDQRLVHIDQFHLVPRLGEHLGDAVAHGAAADDGDALNLDHALPRISDQRCTAHGDGVAAAQAQRRHAAFAAALAQRVDAGSPGCALPSADGMAQRHRAAVDVETLGGYISSSRITRHALRGEGLVELDQVVVGDARLGLLEQVPHAP